MRYAATSLVIVATAALTGCVSATSADKTVELSVGQTRHLTAYRADGCGAAAPAFDSIVGRLPRSEIVSYSDAGLSSRRSVQCGRQVPTRAVNATGVKAGSEVKRYQSETVSIVVR